MFNVIIDTVEFRYTILLFVFCLTSNVCFFVAPFLPSLGLFEYSLEFHFIYRVFSYRFKNFFKWLLALCIYIYKYSVFLELLFYYFVQIAETLLPHRSFTTHSGRPSCPSRHTYCSYTCCKLHGQPILLL